jgi:cation diffusion facilitator family transporter
MQPQKQNIQIQKQITLLAIILFVIKIVAYYLTHSVAILTDALESIVNIVAGFLGVYTLSISARPKDKDHPYGHGKVEFLSAAIEGTLIIITALFIIYGAIKNITNAQQVSKLDIGLLLMIITAIINYIVGYRTIAIGKKNNVLPLVATGNHLLSDTYTTIGIVVGLVLLYFTNIFWIDSAVAILFSIIILYTGYKIIRSSIAGIMDEADEELLHKIIIKLNDNKKVNWIDLHNLRIIKYGSVLHLDAHLTVPWYFDVLQAHKQIDELTELLRNTFGESLEIFVHTDACTSFSCAICEKKDCTVRENSFVKRIIWNKENISLNEKHHLGTN